MSASSLVCCWRTTRAPDCPQLRSPLRLSAKRRVRLLVASHCYRIASGTQKEQAETIAGHRCRRHTDGERVFPGMGGMPGDPKECRQRALNCLLLAKEATTEQAKKRFLELAQAWTKLAAELEDTEALLKTLGEIDLKDVPEPEDLPPPCEVDFQSRSLP